VAQIIARAYGMPPDVIKAVKEAMSLTGASGE
jgi:hypothetical protein